MEKYGVAVDEDKVKTAGAERRCPECGSVLSEHGKVCLCSTHGSEPFEGADVTTVSSGKK